MSDDKAAMREHLATKVMKWYLVPETNMCHAQYYDPLKYNPNLASDEQGYEVLVKDWDPFINYQQCHRVLDAWQSQDKEYLYQIVGRYPSGKIRIHLRGHLGTHGGVTEAYSDSFCEAVCVAIYRASGFKKE